MSLAGSGAVCEQKISLIIIIKKICFLPCTEISFIGWDVYGGATGNRSVYVQKDARSLPLKYTSETLSSVWEKGHICMSRADFVLNPAQER